MVIGTATAAALVGVVRVECILTVRYNLGYTNGASEKAKKATRK